MEIDKAYLETKKWYCPGSRADAEALLKAEEVQLEVSVGNGGYQETFWGCDLSQEFVAENAFYTT